MQKFMGNPRIFFSQKRKIPSRRGVDPQKTLGYTSRGVTWVGKMVHFPGLPQFRDVQNSININQKDRNLGAFSTFFPGRHGLSLRPCTPLPLTFMPKLFS